MTITRRHLAALTVGLGAGFSFAPGLAASLNVTSQAFAPYQTCILTAYPATTSNALDATVRQAQPTNNFGTTGNLMVSSSSLANQRIYLQFNLSACTPAIPKTAIVRLATLRLFATQLPATCRAMDFFAATSAWAETAITWNNQPFGTATNNPPTGSRSASVGVGSAAGCQNATVNAYITGAVLTGDVQAFVAQTRSNFGWMLRDDAEDAAGAWTSRFASKEAAQVSRAPQLVVTYVSVP